ncbi:MAG: ATP-binding protein [Vicinamibacterales bacterium]
MTLQADIGGGPVKNTTAADEADSTNCTAPPQGPSARLTFAAGCLTTLGAAIVLAGWANDSTLPASIVSGWRVMVPSTAFVFLIVGIGLAVASSLGTGNAGGAIATRVLALVALVLPALTLAEHLLGTRWYIESWLGPFPPDPLDAYTGRMSPMASLCFVLLSLALGALTFPGRLGAAVVRNTAGAALTLSWLGVVAISFDTARLDNIPGFPGMAVPTIVFLAVTAAGLLACSAQAVSHLREADAEAVLDPKLLAGAFVLPPLLGLLQAEFARWVPADMAAALAAAGFGACVTATVWRGVLYMQGLKRQRNAVMADLEARVLERTRALEDANTKLQRSQAQLRDADRRKDEFIATLAHELRNPLAPMVTGMELLRTDGTGPEARMLAHDVVSRQIRHMVRLIDDLLDVSRITADKLTLRLEPVNVIDVLEQAVETAREHVLRDGHELSIDVPRDPVVVEGDATRLTQVFANLLLNACRYTPAGGHISLHARVHGAAVVVRVRDTGIGIPEEFLPRLFDKFSQVASPLDRRGGGLGLGLALVRGIVSLHGGSVEVRSEGSDQGSEFTVRLPLSSSVVASVPPANDPASVHARGRRRRVLVVDDNEDNVRTLAAFLASEGHDVETAADGEAGLARAEQFRPDVVLLDIGMPGVNGYEVCRTIRQRPWGRAIYLIAQTGWGQAEDRRRTHEAGFDTHMVKPLDLDVLRERLADFDGGTAGRE